MKSTTETVLLTQKTFDMPDEVRRFDRGFLEVLNFGDYSVARATFQPDWHWAEHVKPLAQTELCEVEHMGYVLSGRMKIRTSDGAEAEYQAGDVMAIKPGHDAWVLGREPCIIIDWAGASTYAKR